MQRTARQRLLAAAGAVAAPAFVQSATAAPQQITSKVDESVLTTLAPNVPLGANAANDRGRVADNMHIDDMMLLLHRSDAQQAELKTLNHDQLDHASPHYHQWLTAKE